MIRSFLVLCFLSACLMANGQHAVDVLHYKYEIELSDKSDTIKGTAYITVHFVQQADGLTLDLKPVSPANGKGMSVNQVRDDSARLGRVEFRNDKIKLFSNGLIKAGEIHTYMIRYEGIPADGLIISKNKFGKRTFFADNWPNRASHWIPCVDDPADKASVEFIVTAPAHYKIVSNGVLVRDEKLPGDKQLSHWKEDIPLPTKIMVIAAADFAVKTEGTVQNIPVSTWVFEQNARDGFRDYAPAVEILAFMIDYIGPFPYNKLANVQSKTIFGGMENASVIFYAEETVNGKQDQHTLIAHEIAHQWFGDMVTEKKFAHLWLSEGFATYLAVYFNEKKFGLDKAKELLEEDRAQAIAFSRMTSQPVVDTVSSFMELLNANSYQKGCWVLHMLRRETGDSAFRKGIQSYYTGYAGKNADTRDLQHVFEKVTGKDLSVFFHQWLYTPGIPKLDIQWKYNEAKKTLDVTITQLQKNVFIFPLELLVDPSSKTIKKIKVSKSTETFSIPLDKKPTRIKADPEVNLLFEGSVNETQ